LKIDTTYDSKYIKITGHPRHKKDFYKIPLDKGFINIHEIDKNTLNLSLEFNDTLLPKLINGNYKLFFQ
jgi:hypothetical protein